MAILKDMRAAVIARCSEFRPNQDFPVPDLLVDYEIFNAAGEVLYDHTRMKRTVSKIQPWMYTRFGCQVPKLDKDTCIAGSDCYTSYVLDMPFRPMEIEGAIGSVILQGSGRPLNYIHIHQVPYLKYQEFTDYDLHPAFTISDDKMYFFGKGKYRERDFSKSKIMIWGVVGSLIPDSVTGCIDDDANVPVVDGLRGKVIDLVVSKIFQGLGTPLVDQIDDGNANIRQ